MSLSSSWARRNLSSFRRLVRQEAGARRRCRAAPPVRRCPPSPPLPSPDSQYLAYDDKPGLLMSYTFPGQFEEIRRPKDLRVRLPHVARPDVSPGVALHSSIPPPPCPRAEKHCRHPAAQAADKRHAAQRNNAGPVPRQGGRCPLRARYAGATAKASCLCRGTRKEDKYATPSPSSAAYWHHQVESFASTNCSHYPLSNVAINFWFKENMTPDWMKPPQDTK